MIYYDIPLNFFRATSFAKVMRDNPDKEHHYLFYQGNCFPDFKNDKEVEIFLNKLDSIINLNPRILQITNLQ